jgi:hypothetical protein
MYDFGHLFSIEILDRMGNLHALFKNKNKNKNHSFTVKNWSESKTDGVRRTPYLRLGRPRPELLRKKMTPELHHEQSGAYHRHRD